MTSFRVRPRFELSTSKSVKEINEILHSSIGKHETLQLAGIDTHIVINIKEELQHFWSPQCSINIEVERDGQNTLRGLYGPNPNVWSIFIFSYAALLILLTFITIIGFSRYSLGLDASVLWLIPLLIIGLLILYFASQFGQKMGAEETFNIHHFIEESLHKHVTIN
jgi:hypothetical protein